MIKPQPVPVIDRVASSADRLILVPDELTEVRVLVAGHALLRDAVEREPKRFLIRSAHPVAIQTTGSLVAANETVVGALVVEVDLPPALDPMAGETVSLEHESVESRLMRVLVTGAA